MLYPKAHHRPAISQFRFFRMVHSRLSFTRRSVTIHRSPTRVMRFTLSPVGKVSCLTESSDVPSRLVHFCSFLPARFIASRTFHPTSSFGLFFMERKEESRMPGLGVMRRCLLVFVGMI